MILDRALACTMGFGTNGKKFLQTVQDRISFSNSSINGT
jgi:hypothetical protein